MFKDTKENLPAQRHTPVFDCVHTQTFIRMYVLVGKRFFVQLWQLCFVHKKKAKYTRSMHWKTGWQTKIRIIFKALPIFARTHLDIQTREKNHQHFTKIKSTVASMHINYMLHMVLKYLSDPDEGKKSTPRTLV